MFFDRVRELETQQQVLWGLVNNNKDKPEIQIKAIHELNALSVNLFNAYQNLRQTAMLEVPFLQQHVDDPKTGDNLSTVF